MHISRTTARYIGAAAAAAMAVIYFLIGLNVLYIGTTTEGATDQFGFGVAAGIAFATWAVLLALVDRRWLWFVGLGFHALVFVIYIGASGIRVPPFEVWGLTLRAIHVVLLVALVYLAARAPRSRATSPYPAR
jgi:hypothetical protein